MEASLLAEADPEGHLLKLELATGEGLLTLHPESQLGNPVHLHGNVVRGTGVEHVTLDWSRAHALLVGSSPVTAALAVAGAAAGIGVGEGANIPVLDVGVDLRLRPATWRIAHTAPRRWRLVPAGGGSGVVLELDADGLPTAVDGVTWPLELHEPDR